MRFAPCLCLALAVVGGGCALIDRAPVKSVEIETIRPRYIEREAFVRISEYLSGRENTGDRVIVRSNSDARSGFYFVLLLDAPASRLPIGTEIVAEVLTPFSPEIQTFRFELPADMPASKEIFVGLTGDDWPSKEGPAGAWRFTIENASGNVMGRRASYLWEK